MPSACDSTARAGLSSARWCGAEPSMLADIEWDHEVDVLCVGAEGSVVAAGVVAANAGLDVYVGISTGSAADSELAASLGYQGSDKQTKDYLTGFDFAF